MAADAGTGAIEAVSAATIALVANCLALVFILISCSVVMFYA